MKPRYIMQPDKEITNQHERSQLYDIPGKIEYEVLCSGH